MSNPTRHRRGPARPTRRRARAPGRRLLLTVALSLVGFGGPALAGAAGKKPNAEADRPSARAMLVDYFERASAAKPFVVRDGADFVDHRRKLRRRLLESVGLWPLPERISLDARPSEPLDHPWCEVRRVAYRLWPGVYSTGLLYRPKRLAGRPAPAMLCPHGHWKDGNAHPEVQKRCLSFARLGYVTFSSTQNHYEDPCIGVSHQTLMVWNNMRALDYLESLAEVDAARIGVAGASGGGLQTEMIVALDDRVRAAGIVGLTCNFREIMFPDRQHCSCNHFPGVMQFTDHPEISALGFPAPVQYLTMNDWTRNFERDNLPTIRKLYAEGGFAERIDCKYYDTPHSYDKPKRERTYRWMERWVRGEEPADAPLEPDDVTTFPVETLTKLSVEVAEDKGFGEISNIYRKKRGFEAPALSKPADWRRYRERMVDALESLLGRAAELPRSAAGPIVTSVETDGDLAIERVACPSEGPIVVPATLLRPKAAEGKLPVIVVLDGRGQRASLQDEGPASARSLAREGALVAVADVRCYGELFSAGGKDENTQRRAWERNGIVWGRPVPGMASTDLGAVLNALATRPHADMDRVELIARSSGGLAIAALFAAAMDERIASADVDLAGSCFEKRNLPLVPFVLQHGDVLQWAALVADRELTLRNVPTEAGDPQWLADVFAVMNNREGLRMETGER
ncbi:MAG: alpha/beta hydrolase family protein [Planctomycetota bacterium]